MFLVGCSGRLDVQPVSVRVPVPAPLAPGNYFRHGYSTCADCVIPEWAVVLRVTSDEGVAASVAREASSYLPIGYPWLQHTDDLALADSSEEGIAVVGGLFATVASARAWMNVTRLPEGARLLRLLGSEEAIARWHRAEASEGGGARLRTVVTIGLGDAVAAYPPDAVPEFARAIDPDVVPRCFVRPFDSFTVTLDELFGTRSRGWAPVRCAGEPAFVRWSDTLLESTLRTVDDRDHRLVQVVDVECDRPTFGEWRYDRSGRRELRSEDVRLVPEPTSRSCEEP